MYVYITAEVYLFCAALLFLLSHLVASNVNTVLVYCVMNILNTKDQVVGVICTVHILVTCTCDEHVSYM